MRGWQSLSYLPLLKPFFITVFLLFSLSFILVKIFSEKIPPLLYDSLLWIGSLWFAFLLYFVLILLLIDLTRLIDQFISFIPVTLKSPNSLTKFSIGLGVTVLVLLITLVGFINRTNFKIKTLELTIPKQNSALTELNIVMFSDLHLSPINDESFLTKIVEKVNSLKPDIILLPGDIVDDKPEILKRNGIGESFKKLNPGFGVLACTGNHEFINGAENSVKFMKDKGISVLRDELIKINDSLYIIGREDKGVSFTGDVRKSLNEILKEKSENLPTILLDHTPTGLNEAAENKVDLQLSGHTHNGQMFPLNFITRMIYEVSWGYLKKEETHYYVSSGVGSWGPPVKLASNAEIVNIKIRFK
jgi:uncharacterized protein